MPIYDAEWQNPFGHMDRIVVKFEDPTYFMNGQKGYIVSLGNMPHYVHVTLDNAPNKVLMLPVTAIRHAGMQDNPVYPEEWGNEFKRGDLVIVTQGWMKGTIGKITNIRRGWYTCKTLNRDKKPPTFTFSDGPGVEHYKESWYRDNPVYPAEWAPQFKVGDWVEVADRDDTKYGWAGPIVQVLPSGRYLIDVGKKNIMRDPESLVKSGRQIAGPPDFEDNPVYPQEWPDMPDHFAKYGVFAIGDRVLVRNHVDDGNPSYGVITAVSPTHFHWYEVMLDDGTQATCQSRPDGILTIL